MSTDTLLATLTASTQGHRVAAEELIPLVYSELRAVARARLARLPAGHTLSPTALVHEAYARLVERGDPGWEHRAHFFGAAARAMRNVLVDHARRRVAAKRSGPSANSTELETLEVVSHESQILSIHEVLVRLEAEDPRKRRLIDLRYFLGLSTEETAEILGVSPRTVEREWRYVKSWMRSELSADEPHHE